MTSVIKWRSVLIATAAPVACLLLAACNKNKPEEQREMAPFPSSPGTFGQRAGGNDGNIGVGGGSTTFYLRAGDWSPAINTPTNRICAPVADASVIHLDGFEGDFRNPILQNTSKWKLLLKINNLSVTMSADNDICGAKTGPGVSVSVTAPATVRMNTSFYAKELRSKFHNRRIKAPADPSCAEDEDMCERLSEVILNRDHYKCDTLNCWIYIGKVPH